MQLDVLRCKRRVSQQTPVMVLASRSGKHATRPTMLAEFWRLLKAAFDGWWADRAMSLGASIAFFTVFSLAPMLLAAIAVAGLVFGREAAQGAIVAELGSLVGETGAKAVEAMIASASNIGSGVIGTVVGIITFVLVSTGAFVELQDDLNLIWKVKPRESSGVTTFLRTRFLSLALVVGVGFLLLVSLILDAGVTALGSYLEAHFSGASVSISLIPPCVSVHSATCDGFAFADLGVRRPALGGQTVSDQGCRLGLWGSPVKPASIRRRRTGPR
jgi:membrane protein